MTDKMPEPTRTIREEDWHSGAQEVGEVVRVLPSEESNAPQRAGDLVPTVA